MPLAAAGVGFGVTLALLVGLWLLMCYTALLLVRFTSAGRRIPVWAPSPNVISAAAAGG